MKQFKRLVLLVLVATATIVAAPAGQAAESREPASAPQALGLPDTIIIGWDGVQRDHFWQCYNKQLPECPNGLPNIAALSGNTILDFTVTNGATDTMSGWTQILSGYDVDVTGVYSNLDYQPLSEGYSIFEKLEAYFGDEAIDTVFISGKGINVSGVCQGELTVQGRLESKGQAWCLAKRGIDSFTEAEDIDIPNSTVGTRALAQLDQHFAEHGEQTLFAFFHFAEPDHTGHAYGEDSAQYSQALVDLDDWLGSIVSQIEDQGTLESTLVYVVTDHGFDDGEHNHWNAPYGILATNDPLVVRGGDRKDLAPTLLERYGVVPAPGDPIPPVDGRSLYSIPAVPCVGSGAAFLDYPGSPACCEGLSLVSLNRYDDFSTAKDRCFPATGGSGDGSGYCTPCGDGQCSEAETVCNCPQDCTMGPEGGQPPGGLLAAPGPLAVECPPGTIKTTLLSQDFSAWPPSGWSLVNNAGNCAVASNSIWSRPNNTGGEGACADADSDRCGAGTTMDTELRTPLLNLSGVPNVYLQYKTYYLNYLSQDHAFVDISTDGGATWSSVLAWNEDHPGPATVDLDLTPYTGSATTIIRWRYQAPGWHWYWEIDDVDVAICAPAPPAAYLTPEFQEGAGCPGSTVDYELSLWNDTGSAGTVHLSYGSAWPVYGPSELFAEDDETVSFSVSVDVLNVTEVNVATVTAEINGHTDQVQLETAGRWNWEFGSAMPTPRGDLAVVASAYGLYAIGGTAGGAAPGNGENERYDLLTGSWTTVAPMPLPMTLIDGDEIDGIIYIPGGYDGSTFTSTTLAYDTASDTWSTVAPAPRGVAGYGAATCEGRLYRVGGSQKPVWPRGATAAEVYDPATNTWTLLPSMSHGHTWPGVACLAGKLYVAGGIDSDGVTATAAEVYDIATAQWDDDAMADLPLNWWGSADLVVNGVLFLAGGRTGGEERAASLLHDLFYYTATDYWTVGPLLQESRYRSEGDSALSSGYVLGGWGNIWQVQTSAELLSSCPAVIFAGSTTDGTAGGVAFSDEDILAFDTGLGTWSVYFDGSDVGLSAKADQDLDAFHFLPDGSILLSIVGDTNIPDLGKIDDSDIVRFLPTSLGPDTAGTFQWFFDASDVGLSARGEDVDAVEQLADGRLLFSTTENFSVVGVSGADEDLIVFWPTSLGANTSGTWAMYFDGSDVALTATSEDLNAVSVDEETGDIYLSTVGTFSVAGSSGDGADIFVCHPLTLGSNTSCTFGPGLHWDGSANGFAGEVVDGLAIGLEN